MRQWIDFESSQIVHCGTLRVFLGEDIVSISTNGGRTYVHLMPNEAREICTQLIKLIDDDAERER